MEIKKEVIRPGTYTYIDPDGRPQKFTATPQLISHWHDSGKKMIAKGLSVPIPFEHDEQAHPLTKSEQAANNLKNNAGEVKDYQVENGILYSVCNVTDPLATDKIGNASIKWTSPWISSFVDGDGEKWDNVIAHLALTSRPRIHKQEPFPSMAAALSMLAKTKTKYQPEPTGMALSRAGLLTKKGPAYPIAFSLWTGIKLSEEEMKKMEKKKPEEKKPEGKPPEGKKPPMKEGEEETPEEEPEMELEGGGEAQQIANEVESMVDTDGDISVCDVICDLLEMVDPGLCMPDDTTDENFLERLYQTMMDFHKGKKVEETMPEPTPPATPEQPKSPVVAEQPPLLMSLEQINKIPDQMIRSAMLSLHAEKARIDKLTAAALAKKKTSRGERIKELSRFLTPKDIEGLTKQCDGMKLSLTDAGEIHDDADFILDMLEAQQKQLFDAMPELFHGKPLSVVNPPEEINAVNEKKIDDAADRVAARVTGIPTPKAS